MYNQKVYHFLGFTKNNYLIFRVYNSKVINQHGEISNNIYKKETRIIISNK